MYQTNIHKTDEKKTGSGKSMWWLISSEDGAPTFEMRYIKLKEKQQTTGSPHAYEHEIFVVEGEGRIKGDNDKEINIHKGDAVLILPNEKHQIINSGNGSLSIICVIPKGEEDHIK